MGLTAFDQAALELEARRFGAFVLGSLTHEDAAELATAAVARACDCQGCPRGKVVCWVHGSRGEASQRWQGAGPAIDRSILCNVTSGEIVNAR